MASVPLRTESELVRQSEATQPKSLKRVNGEERTSAVDSLLESETNDRAVSFEEFLSCEFTDALLDHFHRAKRAALLENGE